MLRSLVLVVLATLAHAQIEQRDRAPLSLASNSILAAAAQIDLSAQAPNVAALLAEDAKTNKTVYRVGAVLPTRATIEDFSGTVTEEGTVYRLQVTSPGALGMGINFNKYALPEGATLHMYTPDGTTVRGAYTDANHKHYGGFAITPVPGASLVLELFVPSGGHAALEVESVVHHCDPARFEPPNLLIQPARSRILTVRISLVQTRTPR